MRRPTRGFAAHYTGLLVRRLIPAELLKASQTKPMFLRPYGLHKRMRLAVGRPSELLVQRDPFHFSDELASGEIVGAAECQVTPFCCSRAIA